MAPIHYFKFWSLKLPVWKEAYRLENEEAQRGLGGQLATPPRAGLGLPVGSATTQRSPPFDPGSSGGFRFSFPRDFQSELPEPCGHPGHEPFRLVPHEHGLPATARAGKPVRFSRVGGVAAALPRGRAEVAIAGHPGKG